MITSARLLSLFLWIAVPVAGYGLYAGKGLPHIIFAYTFDDNGARYDLSVERYYRTCTFIGPNGTFTVNANSGKCGWIKFFKKSGNG
ncbi:hypothetical protein [Roseibium album]|uniref:Uncharacterized protein n=1 Tax=Roseibium album TaxID=311410 RepID=A0A0M7A823_9HYPH|nr:hypothetical protein [Roseibium album]CTQ58148.1 hypothetical protein LA5094_00905 [Roseibium album]CTQ65686.1 hypothetical protein LA5096_00816 [Roseibium album]CTQ70566.1 hypothetical protein LA5095_01960 [Roseibium album]